MSEYLSQRRKGRKGKDCHFERREKSFLDPAHSLGMTGFGLSLGVLSELGAIESESGKKLSPAKAPSSEFFYRTKIYNFAS
jgi:hypothetical protein